MKEKINKILWDFAQSKLTHDEATQQVLDLFAVSQQRELLSAFFDELDELPMGLMHYDREKVVERFIDNNCG